MRARKRPTFYLLAYTVRGRPHVCAEAPTPFDFVAEISLNHLHRYAADMLQDFNPFDFVASIFYYENCWPNRVLEWALVIASCLIIATIDPLGGLAATAFYLLAYTVRDTCAVCSAVQGIGICIAAVCTILGKFGFIAAVYVFLGYVAVFAMWLGLVYLIWRRG